ncbi:MAG TPA: NAD(P)H-dependent oxidoreductase [Bacteroidales bacterium]
MKVMIVYAHPSKKSFTYQVLARLVDGLLKAHHRVEISDLYEMNFRSEMTEEEYEREGFSKTDMPLPEDVKKEHDKIEKADCIIFVYPVWWSDCPARLKGWFDRVYSVGYAYGYGEKGEKRIQMKKQKLGLVICTAGHSNEFLEEIGIAESMRKIMIDDRLGMRFERKEMFILGGTLEIDKVKESHLNKAYEIGEKIESYCTGITT